MWDVARWAGLAAWAVVVVTALLVGERPASFEGVRTAVAQGRVDRVEVSGGLSDGAVGSAVEDVSWREGWRRLHVEVLITTPGTPSATWSGSGRPTTNLTHDAGAVLTAARPDDPPTVVRVEAPREWSEVFGWRCPSWVGLLTIPLFLLLLALLLGGPHPWRATRWAWAWLLMADPTPYGIAVFLALSGRTPPLPSPRPGARRLTGGWALLLGIVVVRPLLSRWS